MDEGDAQKDEYPSERPEEVGARHARKVGA